MTKTSRRKVPRCQPLFPVREALRMQHRPRLSPEEIARREVQNETFARRCREIFWRVYPELVKEHYNWFIHIEPESGDYFIDADGGG